MTRVVSVILALLLLGYPAVAGAQKPAAAPAPASAAAPAITADQARLALDVLNDPAKRAAFTATLSAIIKAQPGGAAAAAEPATAPETAGTAVGGITIPLAPDSLGAQVIVTASAFVNRLGNQVMDGLDAVQSLPLLYGWTVVMLTNPVARNLLLDVTWRVGVALGCALAVSYGLWRLMRRPIHGLEGNAPVLKPTEHGDDAGPAEAAEAIEPAPRPRPSPWTFLRRVPLVLARLVLELVPVLGILATGHLVAGSSIGGPGGSQTISRLVILAVIDAYALSAAILSVARMVLSPSSSRLRLFHLSDADAAYLMRWTLRIVVIAVVGYAVGETWLLLGLSDVAHEAFQKATGLVLHTCLAIIVLQKRAAVRHWLAPPQGQAGVLAVIRNRLAATWHMTALFFIIVIWLVWAIELPHGFTAVLRYFVITGALLLAARLTLLLLIGGLDRLAKPGSPMPGLGPVADARLRVYLPVINGAIRLTIYVLCILGLLQLYGLNTFIWLVSSALGLRILSSLGTLVTTIVLAFAVWEAVNTGVQQHLDRLQREAQMAKSARLRTLLPLLRTTLMIAIAVVAGLMTLSEIGINIAPLLAGAGILGVAIGFGSQKLVQDLITGIFLLLENAMQVGDWVTVSGLSGSVEALSVRTIRLRAGDGSVHIIPFSAVTSVTNVNRGLGNAAVEVTVDFHEDTDKVAAELKAIVAGMRAEPAYSAMMLSDLQLWGVDKVDGGAVTVLGQVVCTDSGRWAVQREFNRRMKRRFQELGIRVYNPRQTIALPLMQVPALSRKEDAHGQAQAAD